MNNFIIKSKNGISYLQFTKLLEYESRVKHAVTLRPIDIKGNDTYYDNIEEAKTNYKKICDTLDLDYKQIYRPYQLHTNNVKNIIEEKPGVFMEELKNIDALVTNKKNKILTIGVADCIDIMFYDPVKNVIGNTHSGWKGTYQEISVKTVDSMVDNYNCDVKDILCFFGPSIRKCHFEVDDNLSSEFYNKFKDLYNINKIISRSSKTDKDHIDTVLINKTILINKGLREENIFDCNICTVCESEKFHSYRVDGINSGRNMCLITLI